MPQLAEILLGAGLTLGACFCAGRVILPSLRLPPAIRFGLGAAVFSYAIFLTLILGQARDRVLLGLLAAAVLLIFLRRPGLTTSFHWARSRTWWFWLGMAGSVAYGGYLLLHALAPEIQPDARTYHLGLVREWLNLNGFPDRAGFYEALPHGLEMLFVPAFAIGRHAAAKLVHFAFLVAVVPLFFNLGKRLRLERWQSAVGAGLFVCAPVVAVTGTAAYNDLALVFYTLATAYLVVAWDEERDPRLAIVAGVTAGFCYAIKFNGLLVAPAALLWFLWRKQWRSGALYTSSSLLVIAPWMIRNAVWIGNPFAPFFNTLFENPYFHIFTEGHLTAALRDYGALPWTRIPWELTVSGHGLQGLTGPVFLLAPLSLFALRRRAGRRLLVAAAIFAIPWLMNHGSRFLLPSLAFGSLAIAVALPRRLALTLLLAHAALATPLALDVFADPNAWRLPATPLRAALRLEPEPEYLRDAVWDYELAELVRARIPFGERFLDLFGAPSAYFDATAIGPWHSASADRMRSALLTGATTGSGVYGELEASWKTAALTALRFRLVESNGPEWSIHEVRPRGAGDDRAGWSVAAWPNIWEAPLALDGNLVSKWAAWETPRPGCYLQVNFPAAIELNGAALIVPAGERQTAVEFLGRNRSGVWHRLSRRPGFFVRPQIDLRRSATRVLRGEGVHYILAPVSGSEFAPLGRNLLANPGEWGIEAIGRVRDVYLFRLL